MSETVEVDWWKALDLPPNLGRLLSVVVRREDVIFVTERAVLEAHLSGHDGQPVMQLVWRT